MSVCWHVAFNVNLVRFTQKLLFVPVFFCFKALSAALNFEHNISLVLDFKKIFVSLRNGNIMCLKVNVVCACQVGIKLC